VAAQDEGQVPFDKLPLVELKRWMEDWLDLYGHTSIIGGTVPGGGGTTINNLTELGFMREQDALLVPRPAGVTFQAAATALNNDQVYTHRFVAPRALEVSGIRIMEDQQGTGTSKVGVGIWDAAGTTLLASSAMTAAAGGPIDDVFTEYPFTTNQILTEGVEYQAGLANDIDTGTYRVFEAVYSAGSIYDDATPTVASIASEWWGARFSGLTLTTVPADLSAAAGASGSQSPVLLLVTV
jgi:hypothetical protein